MVFRIFIEIVQLKVLEITDEDKFRKIAVGHVGEIV
jgi:hypothetical protein